MNAKLILPEQKILTKSDSLKGYVQFENILKGSGRLSITWTDSYGRIVQKHIRQVTLQEDPIEFEISLTNAIAMLNFLEACFEINNELILAPKVEFIVTPEVNKLDDYTVIMYNHYDSKHQNSLRDVGVTAGQMQSRTKPVTPDSARIWWENNFRFYCDQIAVPFYAAYHTPTYKPKHKLLIDAITLYKQDRSKKDAFMRKPCFFDQKAIEDAMNSIRKTVETQMRYKPLMYTTDETGVADLVTAWDFCFDPRTLKEMRIWLLEQYRSLTAINTEWETDFKTIDEVTPFTTDEIMKRGLNNLSPWADHRFFMNKVFADSIKMGTNAAHEVDPEAISGIVGCQMPAAFGGYDYWLLTKATDLLEPYNIGNNREIIRSLAPKKVLFTTSFGNNDFEVWRLWHQALHGDRGIIIYDENLTYLDLNGSPTKMGADISTTYKELTSGIIKLLTHSKSQKNQAAIHLSQSSITAHWMFEASKLYGENWVDRQWNERLESDFLKLRESCTNLMEDNLIGYDFVAYGQLENGEFDNMDKKLLLLPQSISMSELEVDAIKRFVENGGVLIADCRTAIMDQHCKKLPKGQLDDLFGIRRENNEFISGNSGLTPTISIPNQFSWANRLISIGDLKNNTTAESSVRVAEDAFALFKDTNDVPCIIVKNHGRGKTIYLNINIIDYRLWRLKPLQNKGLQEFWAEITHVSEISNKVTLSCKGNQYLSGIELFTYELGSMQIIAIHRNYQKCISKLGPPEYQDQSELERDLKIELDIGAKMHIYDIREGKYLGERRNLSIQIDKWRPTLISIVKAPVEAIQIAAPNKIYKGSIIEVGLNVKCQSPGTTHIIRVQIESPNGMVMPMHTANLLAPYGSTIWHLPFAVNDQVGTYKLKFRDITTGITAEHNIILEE